MTPAEIKAAANAKIVLLDERLDGQDVSLNLAPTNVPSDERAESLLNHADKVLAQEGRHVTIRHAARVRELLARYVSA